MALDREQRLVAAVERDGPTLHLVRPRRSAAWWRPRPSTSCPRVKGGPSWLENEVAACRRCNCEPRAHRARSSGWRSACAAAGSPTSSAWRRVLASLAEAIAARGGQRRARPYLRRPAGRRLARRRVAPRAG